MINFLKRLFKTQRIVPKEQVFGDVSLSEDETENNFSAKKVSTAEEGIAVINQDNYSFGIEQPQAVQIDQHALEIRNDELITVNYNPKLDLQKYKYPFAELIENEESKNCIKNFLESNNDDLDLPLIWSWDNVILVSRDLYEMKNIIITGTQATGKTTFIHQLILSFLFTKHPSQLKFIFSDCKGIEFSSYNLLEKHFFAKLPKQKESVITDAKKLIHTLNALATLMDIRYDLLKEANCRNIKEYNKKFVNKKLNPQKGHEFLPFVVLVIDDLSGFGNYISIEINLPLQRLIKEGYKVGIFNIIATSNFSGDALPSNLLSLIEQRVLFRLNTKEDYRKFFSTIQLERFRKQGEFLYNDDKNIYTGRVLLIDYSEIDKVVEFIAKQQGYPQAYQLPEYVDEKEMEGKNFDINDRDPLFEDAARLIVQNQMGSTSLIQRRMKLGYNRAGRLMDELEQAGIVGPNLGSKARDVLVKTDGELQELLDLIG